MINLRDKFSKRFCVRRDPEYYLRRDAERGCSSACYDYIACRHGIIFPWGDLLAASTSANSTVAKALLESEYTSIWSEPPEAVVVVFLPQDFWQIAAIMRPYRRRPPAPTPVDYGTRFSHLARLHA